MRPIHQALILLTVAAITVGGLLALRRWNPEEKAMVAEQIEMVYHAPVHWISFTKIGEQESVLNGFADVWQADFIVSGHRMQMTLLAYHERGRTRVVPIG